MVARIHALDEVHNPAFGGAAIAVRQDQIGTIGCRVNLSGRDYLLTSGHVLSPTGFEPAGTAVYQPAPGLSGARRLGAVAAVAPLVRSPTANNSLDVGLATIDGQLEARIGTFGTPLGFSMNVSKNDEVRMFGANSGVRHGVVLDTNWSGAVIHTNNVRVGFARLVSTNMATRGGDSGAAVLDVDNRVVGIHLGGDVNFSLFCSMFEICRLWPGLEVTTG